MSHFKATGAIWELAPVARRERVSSVCEALSNEYGSSRLGNPYGVLDDLIFIILSNKTSSTSAGSVFLRVKTAYPQWELVLDDEGKGLRRLLRPAGLSRVKSDQIVHLLGIVQKSFGKCDLEWLRDLPDEGIEEFLISLPGVSRKVAKCVMLYTLERAVLPVDSHVHRLSVRLGWTARRRADQAHEELEALVPPEYRYLYHVAAIQHGRATCRPTNPKCRICPIRQYCIFA